jgi:hypothetical protein
MPIFYSSRWNLRHAPKPVCRIILTQFQHVLWDYVCLSSIFKLPHLHALLPPTLPQLTLGVPSFIYKCVEPLGRAFIINKALAMGRYGDFAQLQRYAATGYCPCHTLGRFCVDGHVATADCSIVTAWNPEALALEDLFRKGEVQTRDRARCS